jgi:hypothetical protein
MKSSKMLQQFYRGFAGAPGKEEVFVTPQRRVADYYAAKRSQQTGLPPGVEAVLADPFAGRAYGHALPVDKLNRDFVTTQARQLTPADVMSSQILEKKQGGLANMSDGGKSPRGKAGLIFTAGKGLFNLLGKSEDDILKMGQAFKGTTRQQNPELAKAIDAYRLGKISRDEYLEIASKLYSPKNLGGPPEKLSPLDTAVAIGPGKASKGLVGTNVNITPGAVYDSRLDIPGYLKTERNVSSMKFPEGTVYGQAEHMGPSKFISDPTKAMRVGLGTPEQAMTPGALEHGMAKSPFAVIRGPHIETDADEIRRMMEFYSKAPEWKEIGMNPYPYSQFFDKQMVRPVWGADEVLKYGNYVLARNPEMTHWKDPRLAVQHEKIGAVPGTQFAEGGLAYMASGGKTPAWQRAEGKNPEGGLNAKGRASYKAETGGTLKRPQPEGGARRDSFCARMTGMKKKLTSSKTASDPDSRINKALRKWNC